MDFSLFYQDIFVHIASYLSDREKVKFLSVCKSVNNFKEFIYFTEPIELTKIIDLVSFHRFTNIIVTTFDFTLPHTITHLTLSDDLAELPNKKTNLEISMLIPKSVKYLKIEACINDGIEDLIPDSVLHLSFGRKFCIPRISYTIPKNVRSVTFGDHFNGDIKDAMHDGIIEINFGNCFNKSIKGILPRFLTHLVLGDYFNRSLKDLPTTLTHLTLGNDFDKPIDFLPDSITHLVIGNEFNQRIMSLPSNLIYLKFGIKFNQRIDKNILNKVEYLIFADDFDQEIFLPNSLIHLEFGFNFNKSIDGILPNNLKYLKFGYKFNQKITGCIPLSVIHLEFGAEFNQNIKDMFVMNKKEFSKLTHIYFGWNFNQDVQGAFPEGTTHILFGNEFNQDIRDAIPKSTKCITFNSKFNHGALEYEIFYLRLSDKIEPDPVENRISVPLPSLSGVESSYFIPNYVKWFKSRLKDAIPTTIGMIKVSKFMVEKFTFSEKICVIGI